MGLLSRMEALHAECSAFSSPAEPVLDFHHFAAVSGLGHCALLVPFGRRFFMRYAHGFDAATILKSVSSADFWNGTLPGTSGWSEFAGTALEPFYQFFSTDSARSLERLCIKSFVILADVQVKAILLTTDTGFDKANAEKHIQSLAEFVASDISNITTYHIPAPAEKPGHGDTDRAFDVDISGALDAVSSDIDYESRHILLPVVESEAYHRVAAVIPKDGFCAYEGQGIIRIILRAARTLDAELLQFQIRKTLEPVLKDAAKKTTAKAVIQ